MNAYSLLREKFTIREIGIDDSPVIALGNRLRVDLPKTDAPLIIRGHSMHMTLRFGAELTRQISFLTHVENVENLFQWETIWEKLIKPFEAEATPESWVSVYYQGNPIFEYNPRHGFFDVIEQCEYKNSNSDDKYEKSIVMAQNAFRKGGKHVLIEEESHVGFILDEGETESRFAVILRIPNQKATFITRMSKNKNVNQKPHNFVCMQFAANYIEAINMSVRIGFMMNDVKSGTIQKGSAAEKKYKSFEHRLTQLSLKIQQSENKYDTKYRPEKPDFDYIKEKCNEVAST